MTIPDPRRAVGVPLRRTLESLELRWVGVYVLAASVVIGPVLCGLEDGAEDWVHAILPFFLLGFIALHLMHRRSGVRRDGWRRAFEADAGATRFALLVASVTMLGVLAALVAIFCPHGHQVELAVTLGVWLPVMAPLYATAIWLAIDSSIKQLGDGADASDRALRGYWRRVASGHGETPSGRS